MNLGVGDYPDSLPPHAVEAEEIWLMEHENIRCRDRRWLTLPDGFKGLVIEILQEIRIQRRHKK